MSLNTDDLGYLRDCARDAAREAGLLINRSQPKLIETKSGGHSPASQIVTEVDRAAQDCILERLAPTLGRFDLGILSEEAQDNGSRLEKDFFWSIDPLDGTLPFVEGVPGYAVSIALVSRSGSPVVGAVYDPSNRDSYCGARGLGISLNGQTWDAREQPASKTLSVFADRSFAASPYYEGTAVALEHLARKMGLQGVQTHVSAGAVMNACSVLRAAPACYFKFPKPQEGGGSLWDFAATACLFAEAGAVATDIYGERLDLNRPDSSFMNHRGALFASNQEIANRIRALRPA